MALALYRKYRPATFAEVVGQEHVTEPLRTALAARRINHAYLFSGPRGCGKTSSARIMARSLNCVEGPTPDPCGTCDSCRALAPEGPGSVDVTELDAASHGGVDDARELRDRAFYAPAESRYRVFIIDEAHMVTTQGFNALLKIVEEPPEHLIFIFATTEPDKVLPTIRSRTHHYPFRLIPPKAMRELLERNVAAEDIPVEPAVYPLVIRAGGGSARDTQSVLDQLLAGAGPEGVTYQRAVALLGVTDVTLIDDMIDGLAADDAGAVFGTVERLAEAGHDPRRFATDLLDRLRDLVLLRSVPDAGRLGLVAVPDEELDRMVEQARRIGPATLTRYAEIVHNGLLEMRGATAPRLLLELLCARMLLPSAAEDEAALLQRVERLERRVTAGGGAAPAAQDGAPSPAGAPRSFERPSQRREAPSGPEPAGQETPGPDKPGPGTPRAEAARAATGSEPAPPVSAPAERPARPAPDPGTDHEQPAPAEQPASTGGGLDATEIRRVWPDLLRKVGERHKPTLVLLQNATLHDVDGETLVLSMPTAPLMRQLDQESRTRHIVDAIHDLFGGSWQVRCVHGGGAAGQATARPTSPRPSSGPRSAPRQEPPRDDARREAPRREDPRREPPRQQQPQQQAQRTAPPARRPAPAQGEPDIPLPPEPEDDEDLHAAGWADDPDGGGPAPVPSTAEDPDETAHRLLSEHLGARPLD
ncbi:DNA polymerase-3 subunit gamma/tau [Amycolatopsis arida]|uniref:DNA polymerase III subunit gamma/tau n=1 Tax=Amycolatopsis arida TaxID=587909 RepID=A0A1I5SA10_9PSEU|nr:DNA polymerase III subunit gamma and tau [Amycolatopsis arida]TDX85341.1 DNA polymerase-3 subunit gamma/tau [Amycolatopsis arida]SFP67628.1 DNA polymerase-3 subunit gamma/tau [Amycolatopsis arida]